MYLKIYLFSLVFFCLILGLMLLLILYFNFSLHTLPFKTLGSVRFFLFKKYILFIYSFIYFNILV